MNILFLDACAVIYRVEGTEPWAGRLRELLTAERRSDPGVTIAISDLTRLECRVRPLRLGQQRVLAAYDRFFGARGLTIVGLAPAVVDLATGLRALRGLRMPDALQAASCLSLGRATRFVTSDSAFGRVPGLEVLAI